MGIKKLIRDKIVFFNPFSRICTGRIYYSSTGIILRDIITLFVIAMTVDDRLL
jgi:hypothetical protein